MRCGVRGAGTSQRTEYFKFDSCQRLLHKV